MKNLSRSLELAASNYLSRPRRRIGYIDAQISRNVVSQNPILASKEF